VTVLLLQLVAAASVKYCCCDSCGIATYQLNKKAQMIKIVACRPRLWQAIACFFFFVRQVDIGHGYQISSQKQQQEQLQYHRRQLFQRSISAVVAVTATTSGIANAAAAAAESSAQQQETAAPTSGVAVIRSEGCYQGQGPACAELAADNAFIQSLQQQSATNQKRNEKERIV
jgi:hypothetical protein